MMIEFKFYLEIIICFLLLFTSSLLFKIFLDRKLPIGYHIGIIGHRFSGKTTLITTIFNEIFTGRIKNFNATLHGKSTIEKINTDSKKIAKGTPLGPTKTQDLFAYSCNMRMDKALFTRTYKIEFADFPGEFSEKLGISEKTILLSDDNFFKWLSTADAFIFVIDIAEYLLSKIKNDNYTTNISSDIRASWQELQFISDDDKKFRNKPVVIVFTKCDLFEIYFDESKNPIKREKEIILYGKKKFPKSHEIEKQSRQNGEKEILNDFNDLLLYFKKECKYFKPIFTSCFACINGKKIGMNELLINVLPKN